MSVKVNDIFYQGYVDLFAENSKEMFDLETWIVTKIERSGTIHLKHKIERVTWGKLSPKHGDFGFLPNLHKVFTKSFENEEALLQSKKLSKTKISALKHAETEVASAHKKLTALLTRIRKAKTSTKK